MDPENLPKPPEVLASVRSRDLRRVASKGHDLAKSVSKSVQRSRAGRGAVEEISVMRSWEESEALRITLVTPCKIGILRTKVAAVLRNLDGINDDVYNTDGVHDDGEDDDDVRAETLVLTLRGKVLRDGDALPVSCYRGEEPDEIWLARKNEDVLQEVGQAEEMQQTKENACPNQKKRSSIGAYLFGSNNDKQLSSADECSTNGPEHDSLGDLAGSLLSGPRSTLGLDTEENSSAVSQDNEEEGGESVAKSKRKSLRKPAAVSSKKVSVLFNLATELEAIGASEALQLLQDEGFADRGAFALLDDETLMARPFYFAQGLRRKLLQHAAKIQKMQRDEQRNPKTALDQVTTQGTSYTTGGDLFFRNRNEARAFWEQQQNNDLGDGQTLEESTTSKGTLITTVPDTLETLELEQTATLPQTQEEEDEKPKPKRKKGSKTKKKLHGSTPDYSLPSSKKRKKKEASHAPIESAPPAQMADGRRSSKPGENLDISTGVPSGLKIGNDETLQDALNRLLSPITAPSSSHEDDSAKPAQTARRDSQSEVVAALCAILDHAFKSNDTELLTMAAANGIKYKCDKEHSEDIPSRRNSNFSIMSESADRFSSSLSSSESLDKISRPEDRTELIRRLANALYDKKAAALDSHAYSKNETLAEDATNSIPNHTQRNEDDVVLASRRKCRRKKAPSKRYEELIAEIRTACDIDEDDLPRYDSTLIHKSTPGVYCCERHAARLRERLADAAESHRAIAFEQLALYLDKAIGYGGYTPTAMELIQILERLLAPNTILRRHGTQSTDIKVVPKNIHFEDTQIQAVLAAAENPIHSGDVFYAASYAIPTLLRRAADLAADRFLEFSNCPQRSQVLQTLISRDKLVRPPSSLLHLQDVPGVPPTPFDRGHLAVDAHFDALAHLRACDLRLEKISDIDSEQLLLTSSSARPSVDDDAASSSAPVSVL